MITEEAKDCPHCYQIGNWGIGFKKMCKIIKSECEFSGLLHYEQYISKKYYCLELCCDLDEIELKRKK